MKHKFDFGTIISIMAVLLVFTALLTSSVYADKTSGSQENVPIEVNVGEDFTITLDANPSTGYSWSLSKPLDKEVVTLVSNNYLTPKTEKNKVGQGGKSVWKFKGAGAGKAVITLEYKRSWEKGKPPAEKKSYFILVKSKKK